MRPAAFLLTLIKGLRVKGQLHRELRGEGVTPPENMGCEQGRDWGSKNVHAAPLPLPLPQREAQRAKMAKIPGMINPNEVEDGMAEAD